MEVSEVLAELLAIRTQLDNVAQVCGDRDIKLPGAVEGDLCRSSPVCLRNNSGLRSPGLFTRDV
jgi:hypothetical protein